MALSFTGRRGSYPLTPDMVTSELVGGLPQGSFLQVAVALGTTAAAAGAQCGERWYSSVMPTHCGFSASGDRATCEGPPPVGPCHLGDPDDLMVCDLRDAAAAQEAYFTAHGTYFTGACRDLPGFVPSPGVGCSTAKKLGGFSATAAHAGAVWGSCVWDSTPAPGSANLTCS